MYNDFELSIIRNLRDGDHKHRSFIIEIHKDCVSRYKGHRFVLGPRDSDALYCATCALYKCTVEFINNLTNASCICARCKLKNDHANPNQADGSYLCYNCRRP